MIVLITLVLISKVNANLVKVYKLHEFKGIFYFGFGIKERLQKKYGADDLKFITVFSLVTVFLITKRQNVCRYENQ